MIWLNVGNKTARSRSLSLDEQALSTPMHSCQLCVVALRRMTLAPMAQDIKARLVLCIVSAYPETA